MYYFIFQYPAIILKLVFNLPHYFVNNFHFQTLIQTEGTRVFFIQQEVKFHFLLVFMLCQSKLVIFILLGSVASVEVSEDHFLLVFKLFKQKWVIFILLERFTSVLDHPFCCYLKPLRFRLNYYLRLILFFILLLFTYPIPIFKI